MRADKRTLADAGMTGLTVATVLRETLAMTMTFVDWYLKQGVDQIVICFDDPDDPAIAALDGFPQVFCVPCTAAFWQELGVASNARFTRRQNAAMNYVYHSQVAGWFLTLDGDELVHLEGRSLKTELERTAESVLAVTVLPAEYLQTPDAPTSLHFRREMSADAVRAVYGKSASLMTRRSGMSGHRMGKTATRAGFADLLVRQHFLQTADGTKFFDKAIGPNERAHLLHFFDQGFDVWRAKLTWRMSSRGYAERAKILLQSILDSADPEPRLREIYNTLHVFGPERRRLLADFGAHYEARLDAGGMISDPFPKSDCATARVA